MTLILFSRKSKEIKKKKIRSLELYIKKAFKKKKKRHLNHSEIEFVVQELILIHDSKEESKLDMSRTY